MHGVRYPVGIERAFESEQKLARPLLPLDEKAAAQILHLGIGNGFDFAAGRRGIGRAGMAVGSEVMADALAERARIDGLGDVAVAAGVERLLLVALDRKSTRLNSSHR